MTLDPALARRAAASGVAIEYRDQLRRTVRVAPSAVRAVLDVLGDGPVPPFVAMRTGEARAASVAGPAVLALEDGGRLEVRDAQLPAGLPVGWHTLLAGDAAVPVVVAPQRLAPPVTARQWGWAAQLYAMPSRSSWGIGDFADLRRLAEWTAGHGGGLVLVNPVHAVAPNPPMQPSPYYPASRRWCNPVYLRVEDTAEYAAAPADLRTRVDALRPEGVGDLIDRDRVWAGKRQALSLLWESSSGLRPMTDDLRRFATWCALAEVHGNDWREWPVALRRPDAIAPHDLGDRVAFHAWLQQLCDEQLRRTQDRATEAGMPIGVVHDLAIGVDPGGPDAWEFQDVLALSARIGAPPDLFNPGGQDWGMPPWHPRRLAEAGYAPLRDLLRAVLSRGGGVRIDHILGMFRMWWIPADATAADGTYVEYDANAMLAVVAVEAHRAGALVIGEDLGTVEPAVRRELADRGLLGTSLSWFERGEPRDGQRGPLRPLASWRRESAASITTHDLPTALAWLRRPEREQMLALLRAEGLLGDDPTDDEIVLAMHAALGRSRARVVLAATGDAIGDLRQPNLPGTVDEYPNWRLPLADSDGRPVSLDEFLDDARVHRLAATLATEVR